MTVTQKRRKSSNIGIILQIVCSIMGAGAIILVGSNDHSVYRLGYLLGCLNAPVWIAVEIYYQQYYLLPVNIAYIWGWIIGLLNHW